MAKTVVGLFSTLIEAQKVKHELVDDGYSADNIRVVANDQGSSSTTGGAMTTGAASAMGTPSGTYGSGSSESGTGIMGSISHFFKSLTGSDESDHSYYAEGVGRGGALVMATVDDSRADAVAAKLEQYGAEEVKGNTSYGTTGTTGTAAPVAGNYAAGVTAGAGEAISVVQEDLVVGKRQVQRGGVRVYSHLVETPVEESVNLREEHVRVNRTPVNRVASEADFQTFKEGSIEMTETAEEAVVGKQARVVEEVTIGKDVSERSETVKDTVRHTEVEVEEIGTDSLRTNADPLKTKKATY